MRKYGPILAIISGAITFILATLGLVVAGGFMSESKWLGEYSVTNSVASDLGATMVYIIIMFVAAFQIMLGIFAFKNGKGIAAFILLGLFGFIFIMTIIAGTRSNSWPTSSIITIVINGLAAGGLGYGLFIAKY